MGYKLAVLLLAANLALAPLWGEPSQSDRYKYAPMVGAAKLWNMIRYLHPRVTGDSTAWDAALIAVIPQIEAVHSDEELAVALDKMLATLHDPCTRIAGGLPGKGVTVQSFDSGTMVIHAGNGELSGSLGAGLMLKMGIPQTSNLVWDIRGSRLPYTLMSRPDIHQLTANGIGYAYREHTGYAPKDGIGMRYYSSALKIVDPPPTSANKTGSKWRQVYLVDKDSAVPFQAIIDQLNGRSTILSEDPPGSLQAGFTELIHVLGKVMAEVRVADVRYPDGTTEFAPTRVMLNRGEEAVKAAVNAVTYGTVEGTPGPPGERPKFEPGAAGFRDLPYADTPYPSREMRLLAAMRVWGILRYFDPYIALQGDKWDDVLVELLPKFADARDAHEYYLAIAELTGRSDDANCVAKGRAIPFGRATAPMEIRMIDDQPVVTRLYQPGTAKAGDVILAIDGVPVEKRIEELSHYIAAPGATALHREIGRTLLVGTSFLTNAKSSTPMKLTVQGKDGAQREVAVTLSDANRTMPPARAGDAIRLINDHIGYADLERVDSTELEGMFEKFHQTAGVIFDLRGYPKGNALAFAAYLEQTNQPVVAELFRNVVGMGADNATHISFLQSELRAPSVVKERYTGKAVALIDGQAASLTGESAMCLKAAGAVLIGSPAFPSFASYGTSFDIPGGVKVSFSGQIPRWPGGKLVYPDGVRPDVEVQPTLAGIRDGRDEVLDAAVAYLSK
jgi:C-terminal processing protease CtpA/Prc